jgi:ABC-type nitrate/sulfonate/bicarbonate transport system permease component
LFRGNRARVISLAAFIGLWQLLSSTGVLIVYAILGLLADAVVRTLERRALAWRPEFGE